MRLEHEPLGAIGGGFLILLGVGAGDHASDAQALCDKITALRVFDDEQGRMNRSLRDVGGAALLVPQFTLYADARRGRRPDLSSAAAPDDARRLYEAFVGFLRGREIPVETGRFGARMKVELENDGPVTIVLSTDAWPEADVR